MSKKNSQMPWVIFNLVEQPFAVPADFVREMVEMPQTVSVPNTPDFIRGVINLRGKVIPVIDFRVKMGIRSQVQETEELISLLLQREQDHKNWIAELELSVKEKRAFKLATDPHKCAFGQWYDNFKTDNRLLSACLEKFDAPHKKIHSIAIKVKEYEQDEDFDKAYALIDRTRHNELAQMIHLFAEVRKLLKESRREIAIILEHQNVINAVAVDSVETIEQLSPAGIDDMPASLCTAGNQYISGIGKRKNDKGLVQLILVEKIFHEAADL